MGSNTVVKAGGLASMHLLPRRLAESAGSCGFRFLIAGSALTPPNLLKFSIRSTAALASETCKFTVPAWDCLWPSGLRKVLAAKFLSLVSFQLGVLSLCTYQQRKEMQSESTQIGRAHL